MHFEFIDTETGTHGAVNCASVADGLEILEMWDVAWPDRFKPWDSELAYTPKLPGLDKVDR